MRLVHRDINLRDGTGSATLIPQEPEDMWHLYNLIRPLDTLRAPAIRKVKSEAATGSSVSSTVRTTLTIRVLRTDFDPTSSELHIAGRVCEENAHVAIGQHHTLDLELNRQFTLSKGGEDGWDSVALEMLREATDMRRRAESWAVVMQEGLANICVVTEYQTILRQRVEVAIPRKRAGHGGEGHEKGLEKFFETTLNTLLRHLDIKAIDTEDGKQPPLLLASPGFTAEGFRKYIVESAQRNADKALSAYARDSILVAHASSGHIHALWEVLKQPQVLARLSETKFAKQAKEVDRFFELLRLDDGRAWYGPGEVEKAVDKGAVGQGGGVLFLSNQLFRSQDVKVRKRWVALHDRVKDIEKGKVVILSSAHESGKRLDGLGGVGAILTFPLEDLDEDVEEEVSTNNGAVGEGDIFGDGEIPNGQNHDRIEDFDF